MTSIYTAKPNRLAACSSQNPCSPKPGPKTCSAAWPTMARRNPTRRCRPAYWPKQSDGMQAIETNLLVHTRPLTTIPDKVKAARERGEKPAYHSEPNLRVGTSCKPWSCLAHVFAPTNRPTITRPSPAADRLRGQAAPRFLSPWRLSDRQQGSRRPNGRPNSPPSQAADTSGPNLQILCQHEGSRRLHDRTTDNSARQTLQETAAAQVQVRPRRCGVAQRTCRCPVYRYGVLRCARLRSFRIRLASSEDRTPAMP